MRLKQLMIIRTFIATIVSTLFFSTQMLGQSASKPLSPNLIVLLSVDDAVELALKQNLDLQIERINPQIHDLNIAEARSAWTSNVVTTFNRNNQNSPVNSFLSGSDLKVTDTMLSSNVGITQTLPWGTSYEVTWDNSRAKTNNIFTNFNPILRSGFRASLTQPLLRNFKIDGSRRQLQVATTNRDISDIQLHQMVVLTVRNVKNAYWELVYSRSALEVRQQSLELAQELLRDNRTRVEIGTMAPISIIEAEAEVARNEESIILATSAISQAEDNLRSLIMDPSEPDFWDTFIKPTDPPSLETLNIEIDTAIENALAQRTDLQQAKKNLENVDTDTQYFKNQTLPDVNLSMSYSAAGLGGTQLIRSAGFPGPIVNQVDQGFGSVLNDLLGSNFPTWMVGLTVAYPLGTSSADANLDRVKLQHRKIQAQIRRLSLQIEKEVRTIGRQITTNLQRVEATKISRQLAERKLQAEQNKFSVGLSTNFQLFQAQRDLSEARNNEIRATLDYNRALVDFEAVQETHL